MAGTSSSDTDSCGRPGSDRLCPGRVTPMKCACSKAVGVLPLRDLRQRVGAGDEVEVRVRVFRGQVGQRVNRVGRPAAVNIDA